MGYHVFLLYMDQAGVHIVPSRFEPPWFVESDDDEVLKKLGCPWTTAQLAQEPLGLAAVPPGFPTLIRDGGDDRPPWYCWVGVVPWQQEHDVPDTVVAVVGTDPRIETRGGIAAVLREGFGGPPDSAWGPPIWKVDVHRGEQSRYPHLQRGTTAVVTDHEDVDPVAMEFVLGREPDDGLLSDMVEWMNTREWFKSADDGERAARRRRVSGAAILDGIAGISGLEVSESSQIVAIRRVGDTSDFEVLVSDDAVYQSDDGVVPARVYEYLSELSADQEIDPEWVAGLLGVRVESAMSVLRMLASFGVLKEFGFDSCATCEHRDVTGLGPDCPVCGGDMGDTQTEFVRVDPPVVEESPSPVPMLLHCPECRARHVDVGEFATRVHHTHSCQACGHTWRPAVVPTVGVRYLPGFRNDGGWVVLRGLREGDAGRSREISPPTRVWDTADAAFQSGWGPDDGSAWGVCRVTATEDSVVDDDACTIGGRVMVDKVAWIVFGDTCKRCGG